MAFTYEHVCLRLTYTCGMQTPPPAPNSGVAKGVQLVVCKHVTIDLRPLITSHPTTSKRRAGTPGAGAGIRSSTSGASAGGAGAAANEPTSSSTTVSSATHARKPSRSSGACVRPRTLSPSLSLSPPSPTHANTHFLTPHLPLPLFLLTTVFAYADGPNRGNIKRRGSATDVAAGQVSFGDPVNECLTLPVPHSYSSLCC